MSDITMCKGTDCPMKDSCYRYTANKNELNQSYFTEQPIKDGKCEMYWSDTSQRIFEQLKNIVNGVQM